MAAKNASSGGEAGAEGQAFALVGSTIGIKEASERFEPLVTWQGAFITARLDGSGLSVTVKGLASYGDRVVTVAVDAPETVTAAIEAALREGIRLATPELRKQAEVSAMQACLSAASRGEEI
jgi:hypothetical protein